MVLDNAQRRTKTEGNKSPDLNFKFCFEHIFFVIEIHFKRIRHKFLQLNGSSP